MEWIDRGDHAHKGRPGFVGLILVAALLSLAAPSAGRAEPGTVVWVYSPDARLASWEEADGVPGRRFIDECHRSGWILRPQELTWEERSLLDRRAAELREDLRVRDRGGSGATRMELDRPRTR